VASHNSYTTALSRQEINDVLNEYYSDALEHHRVRRESNPPIPEMEFGASIVGGTSVPTGTANTASARSSSSNDLEISAEELGANRLSAVAGLDGSQVDLIARDEAFVDSLTADVTPGSMRNAGELDRTLFLTEIAQEQTAKRKAGAVASVLAAQWAGGVVLSGLPWGVAREFAKKGADDIIARAGIEDPMAQAAIRTAVVTAAVVLANYAASTIIRPAVLAAAPHQLTPTDAAKAFPSGTPDDLERQATLKKQQEAALPGNLIGDALGVGSQAVTAGVSTLFGYEGWVTSAVGGGFTGLGQALLNLSTSTPAADGTRVPSHKIERGADSEESVSGRVSVAVDKAIKATAAAKDSEGKATRGYSPAGNVAHEILVARLMGVMQGVFVDEVRKNSEPEELTTGEEAGSAMVSPLITLGTSFYPSTGTQGLGTNRGNTGRLGGNTIKAVKGLDPRTNAGTTQALVESMAEGSVKDLFKLAAYLGDSTHQTTSAASRMPASVAIDMLKTFADLVEAVPALVRPSPPAPESEQEVELQPV
jgi:hypothetical protein